MATLKKPPFVIQTPPLAKESLLESSSSTSRLTEGLQERANAFLPTTTTTTTKGGATITRRQLPRSHAKLVPTLQSAVSPDDKFDSLYQFLQYVKECVVSRWGQKVPLQFVPTDDVGGAAAASDGGASNDTGSVTIRNAGALVQIVFTTAAVAVSTGTMPLKKEEEGEDTQESTTTTASTTTTKKNDKNEWDTDKAEKPITILSVTGSGGDDDDDDDVDDDGEDILVDIGDDTEDEEEERKPRSRLPPKRLSPNHSPTIVRNRTPPKSKVMYVEEHVHDVMMEESEEDDSQASPDDDVAIAKLKPRTKADYQVEMENLWYNKLDRLKAYKEIHGNANVPKEYIPDRSLGAWVASQRTTYKQGKLKQERIDALNALDFVWSFRTIGKSSDMKAKKISDDQDDTTERGDDDNNDNNNEGGGGGDEEENVNWDEPAFERKWKAMYQRMKEYQQLHGDCRVPYGYKQDEKLANWVQHQRVMYRKGKLTEERIGLLNEIGFAWRLATPGNKGTPGKRTVVEPAVKKAEKEQKWRGMLDRLKAFKAEFGHTIVQQRYEKDLELGKWVRTQRQHYKDGNITDEHKAELESLGFVWKVGTIGDRSWADNFEKLKEFKAQYGDCLVPTKWQPDQRLASWVMWQRGKYHQNRLPDEYIRKLDEIGFVWKVQKRGRKINHPSDVRGGYKNSSGFVIWSPSTAPEFWEAQLDKLKAFKTVHGHCNVPVCYFEDLQLAKWVTAQRMMYTKGQLQQERIDKLEAAGFVWRLVRTWEDNFQRLKEYHAIHGNCDVPQDYPEDPKLGRWVRSQKVFSKRKEQSVDRIEKLRSINFVWNPPKAAPTPKSESAAAAKPAPKPKPAPARPVDDLVTDSAAPDNKTDKLKAANAKLSQDRKHLADENRELRRKLKEAEEANAWDERFEELKAYADEHGDCHCPTGGTKLGQWVATQRDNYKQSKLSQERISRLESIGFAWARKRGRRPGFSPSVPAAGAAAETVEALASTSKKSKVPVTTELRREEAKLLQERLKLEEAKRKLQQEKLKLRKRRESLEAARKKRKL